MKKFFSIIISTILSVALGIAAVYVISFLNMVPRSMQVDLPHYMYPDVMPASGMDAYHAEKARERLSRKWHKEMVDIGLIEETTTTAYVSTPEDDAQNVLDPYFYEDFTKPLGYSLIQQGYFTVSENGEADRYFSPGPSGTWYVYDPATKQVGEASAEAAKIPLSYKDRITFTVNRDPKGKISSNMAAILTETEPGSDLESLAKTAVTCFGPGKMKGAAYASLLQYRAAGLFLGFEDETQGENRGRAYYLSGDDRRTLNLIVYNTKYVTYTNETVPLKADIISSVLDGEFYTFDPETRNIGKFSFVLNEQANGLYETNIGALPEGFAGPPVVGKIGENLCCVFAGSSSVQAMDLTNGEIRELPEFTLGEGDAYQGISFVFGTDRLVLFYTTTKEPENVRVQEVSYNQLVID